MGSPRAAHFRSAPCGIQTGHTCNVQGRGGCRPPPHPRLSVPKPFRTNGRHAPDQDGAGPTCAAGRAGKSTRPCGPDVPFVSLRISKRQPLLQHKDRGAPASERRAAQKPHRNRNDCFHNELQFRKIVSLLPSHKKCAESLIGAFPQFTKG